MKTKHLYLVTAILGTVIPYYYFGQFFMDHGLDIDRFLTQMTINNIASFFTWDVMISSLAVVSFVCIEGKRKGMSYLWVYIFFNLTVGVSLALPAFLYARQLKIEKEASRS